jgi:1-deoxy-D-xylulose-5-phosphate synthase
MAFEAMNHAGDIKPDLLVVLNDNEMSISENVGALNNHLAQLLSGKLYSTLREGGKRSSPACRRLKSCSNAPKNISKGWWFRGRCLKSWALTTLGRWTVTMLSVWSIR